MEPRQDSDPGRAGDGMGADESGKEMRLGPSSRISDGDRLFSRVTILLLFGVFLYVLRDGLSPILSGITLLSLLMFARQGVRFEMGIGIVSAVLLGAWFLSEIASMLWPFAVSFVLAYLFAPLVGIMARRISRTLSIGIVVLIVLGALSGIGALVIPRVIDEAGELVRLLPAYGTTIRGYIERLLLLTESYGYRISPGEIQQWFVERLPEMGRLVADQMTGALKGLTSGLAALLNLLMIPFVTFYVLKDYDRIKEALQGILPRRHVASTVDILGRVDSVLGQYVRGQLLVCGFIAVLTALGLSISGIRYSIILGMMAGLLNLIPYVGLAISLGVASLVAVLDAHALVNLAKVVVVFVVVQGVEGNFLSPRVVGQRVGLHPAWVMFALVVAAHFWGFVGMVVAIPAAAVLNIVVKVLTGRYYSSRYYGTASDSQG